MSTTVHHPSYVVELTVDGMTCASCVARVEQRLNAVEGVTATVNLPLASAHVEYVGEASPDQLHQQLLRAVASTGYHATVVSAGGHHEAKPAAAHGHSGGAHDHGAVDQDDTPKLRDLRRRLLVSVPLAVPVVAVSMVPALHFDGWQRVMLLLALPVIGWGAWPFHRAAAVNARHRASTMDTLVSLGIIAATVASVWAAVAGGESYLEVAVTVSVFLLAGRYAEARATHTSAAALRALLDLGAKEVAVLRPDPSGADVEHRVPVSELAVGERFVVRPGEKVAADGVVVTGVSAIDGSLLTGEPMPVEVGPGDDVIGATISVTGRLVVRATAVGEQTRLAQIGRLVKAAQTGKAPVQRLADRVSARFVPAVLVIATATLVAWLLATGDVARSFTAAIAVLIIACPCALGLATPTALLTGTGRGAQLGILIRGPQMLERTRRLDTVVLDKTGTLTTGRMRVTQVHPLGPDGPDALRLAASLEAESAHPIADAILAAAQAAGVGLEPVADGRSDHGAGLAGRVDGRLVAVGRPGWRSGEGVPPTSELAALVDAAEARGETAVVVTVDGRAAGVVALADTVRPTSADAVRRLAALGARPLLLTGDNPRAAATVAAAVGIPAADVRAGLSPEDKVAEIERRQRAGQVVAMVGDGVNDAAALAQADLGIAMGTGTDVAIEAGDLTLVRSDLVSAVDAIQLSRATLRTIKVNLGWAFGYNVAAIPLAAAGLLTPMVAGAAMALSSVLVVSNSLRLRHWTPR
jgi:Cu+-exporting ATPase